MLLPFNPEGGFILPLCRAASDAGIIAAFGAQLYPAALAPAGIRATTYRALRINAAFCIAASLAGLLVWLLAQTADMAGTLSGGALKTVLAETEFGHLVLLQTGFVMAGAALWAARRMVPATLLTGIALLLQAGHSHAWAMDGPSVLLAADTVHVAAAGCWLGSLVPLLLTIVLDSPGLSQDAARRFSPLGAACVCAIIVTAAYQSWILIGSLPALVGTAYGLVALTKAVFFCALAVLALRNRFVHAPRLRADGASRRSLIRSVMAEIIFGLLVILAAGVLTELPPSMHVQAIWPFPLTPSLDAVREDPDIRAEILHACLILALCAAGLLASIVSAARHRGGAARIGQVAVALVAIGAGALAARHFDVLFVPAYPTEFYHSPTGFSAQSIANGAPLFADHCAACHGAQGRGDGPDSRGLPVPPANLTAAHLWMHSDGELFWWLTDGIDAPEGGKAMPGFGGILSDSQRWSLIDYIRAHNAGTTLRADGSWDRVPDAPSFAVQCSAGQAQPVSSLRPSSVLIAFGWVPPPSNGVTRIVVGKAVAPAQDLCVVQDDAWVTAAFAIIAGISQTDLQGGSILVDRMGLLRKFWHAPMKPGELASEVAYANQHAATSAAQGAKTMPMSMPMSMSMDPNMAM